MTQGALLHKQHETSQQQAQCGAVALSCKQHSHLLPLSFPAPKLEYGLPCRGRAWKLKLPRGVV